MNKGLVDQLEKRLGEFDFLFQEWVIFSLDERHAIKRFTHEILAIVNDAFFRTEWELSLKPSRGNAINELVEQIKEDWLNSYQQEKLNELLSYTRK